MALVACAECGHQVSDRAAACPQCGAPVDHPPTTTQAADDSNNPPRVKTASDSVFTRNRGCVDFVFLLPLVLLILYGIQSCVSS